MNSIILDDLANLLKLGCLSDLTTIEIPLLKSALTETFLESYTVEQWSYACSYILGEKIKFNNLNELKSFLEDY